MKHPFVNHLVKFWLRLGGCAVIVLLGGMARAEESKADLFVRWLKVSAVGAPESGLKALPEFKVGKPTILSDCFVSRS